MERLLIAGLGEVARRALPLLEPRFEIRLLGRSRGMDLDRPATLRALEGTRILPTRPVYISPSGVYGDCGGALVDESWPVNPRSARAGRRAHPAGDARLHERIAPAGQHAAQARARDAAALSDGAGGTRA